MYLARSPASSSANLTIFGLVAFSLRLLSFLVFCCALCLFVVHCYAVCCYRLRLLPSFISSFFYGHREYRIESVRFGHRAEDGTSRWEMMMRALVYLNGTSCSQEQKKRQRGEKTTREILKFIAPHSLWDFDNRIWWMAKPIITRTSHYWNWNGAFFIFSDLIHNLYSWRKIHLFWHSPVYDEHRMVLEWSSHSKNGP